MTNAKGEPYLKGRKTDNKPLIIFDFKRVFIAVLMNISLANKQFAIGVKPTCSVNIDRETMMVG